MKVRKITFDRYRNLKNGCLETENNINIIYGDNAQGKTNLLEAIWLFSGVKSFRSSKDCELIQKGEDSAELTLSFNAERRDQEAKIVFGGKKSATLNGNKLASFNMLAGAFRCVVFSPEHLSLIKDGPSERRKFINMAISQIWPKYAAVLYDYMHAMVQRNTLLRDARAHSDLYDMLDMYDATLATLGKTIIEYRKKYLDLLMNHAEKIYDGFSCGKERLTVKYICSGGDDLAQALKQARRDDSFTGVTSVGPHRDDIEFEIDSMSARSFGSQGQQRSVVLSLKLAEAEVIHDYCSQQPVILLDDVMSELDVGRRDYILNHIDDRQVFITCCDKNTVSMLSSGSVFYMKDGVLTKEG